MSDAAREALERLVTACEDAFLLDEFGDENVADADDEDVTSPPSGITFGMIRRAREALDV